MWWPVSNLRAKLGHSQILPWEHNEIKLCQKSKKSPEFLDASELVEMYHEGQEAECISDSGQTSHPLSLCLPLSLPLSVSALFHPLSFSLFLPLSLFYSSSSLSHFFK